MSDLEDAWNNCPGGPFGPRPLGMFFSFSFLTAASAVVTVAATLLLAPLLGPFAGLPGIGTVLGSMGVIASSSVLMALLGNFVFVLVLSLCRLQIRFGDVDFSSLAGRHDEDLRLVVGELTIDVGDELRGRLGGGFNIFPFQDGDYLYNVVPDAVTPLLTETVGGAVVTGDLAGFVERTPGGGSATVMCDGSPRRFLHTEIDSARKVVGHLAAIAAALAILVAALAAAPLLAAIEAACKAIPIIGPAICAAVAFVLALIASAIAGVIGGFIGDAADALLDPRDGVVEGTTDGWEPAHRDCVLATGFWVTDLDHGHNELHPLRSLQRCVGGRTDGLMERAGDPKRGHIPSRGLTDADAPAWLI